MNTSAATPGEPPTPPRRSPYQGIVPYSDADAEWFFGRDESCDIVIDNLRAYRVSVLYGESGVGKSSLLHAAVLARLRAEAKRSLASSGAPETVAVVFADWSVDDPPAALREAIRVAVAELSPELADDPPTGALVDVVAGWCERVRGSVFLVLDQFEEFFLYHSGDAAGHAFEEELTAAVRSREAAANILLGIREDALAKLDRLQERVPGLLDNLLRLDHLDHGAAREAIVRPLEHWNRLGPDEIAIEPALVEEVLTQVEAGKLLSGGAGRVQATGGAARIEAPFLQLVLMRIWDEERAAGSNVMRLATLTRLGGAERIVRTHLDQVLATFSRRERTAAAKAFRFLVTPSGTKIAHQPYDLAQYAGVRPERLEPVLAHLAGEPRILRPVSGGAYEIYHDVLTAAVLDWRSRYEEREGLRLLMPRVLIPAALVIVAITLAAYATHVMRSLEARTVDARSSISGTRTPDDVAVVAIDDATFNDLAQSKRRAQWPFPRCFHATLIDQIAKSRPRAIAIDIQFSDQSPELAKDGVPCDEKLIEAVKRAGNVVLATTEVGANGRTPIFGGLPLKQIRARAGNAVIVPDKDGVIRHVPYATDKLESFGIVAAEIASGHTIPPPSADSPWVDFAGPPGTVRTYSYSRVMDGKVPPSVFRGKLVVIGLSTPSLQDVHATTGSGSELMSGAEIHANVAETALRGFPLRSAARGWDILLIVLFGLLVPVASLRLGFKACLGLALAAAALYLVALQFAFNRGVVLSAAYPLLALALTTSVLLVIGATHKFLKLQRAQFSAVGTGTPSARR